MEEMQSIKNKQQKKRPKHPTSNTKAKKAKKAVGSPKVGKKRRVSTKLPKKKRARPLIQKKAPSTRKFANTNPEDKWQVENCKGDGVCFQEVLDKDMMLSHIFGKRLCKLERESKFKKDPVQKLYVRDDFVYSLVSLKIEREDSPYGSNSFIGKPTNFKAFYVIVSGPGLPKIDIQGLLLEIVDFSVLPTRKVIARLELFQSPAWKTKDGYAIFQLQDKDICEIEDKGHTGK